MNRFLAGLQWMFNHPVEVIGVLMILLAVSSIIGAIVYLIWERHEEQKALRARSTFNRCLQSNMEHAPWPVPPGPKGFGGRKKAA